MKYQDTLSAILNDHNDHLRKNAHDHLYETAHDIICDALDVATDHDPYAAIDAILACDDYYSQRGKLRDCITCIRIIIRDSGIKDEASFAQSCLRDILVVKAENILRVSFPSIAYAVSTVTYSDGAITHRSVMDWERLCNITHNTAIHHAIAQLRDARNPHVINSSDGLSDIVAYDGVEISLMIRDSSGWHDAGIVWELSTLTYQDEQRIEEYMEERDWCIAHGYDSCPGLSLVSVA